MEFLVCDGGAIQVSGQNNLNCQGGDWVGIAQPQFYLQMTEMDGSDIAELLGAAAVALAVAYGVRLCLRLFFPR